GGGPRAKALALLAAATIMVMAAGACTRSSAATAADGAARRDAAYTCPPAASDATTVGASHTGRKLVVATTVAPLTSIVANIAGDRADVTGVIPDGQDI